MNSATRIYDIIEKLSNNQNNNMMNAYKAIFKTENEIEVYKALILLDTEIKDVIYIFSYMDGGNSHESQFIKATLPQLTAYNQLPNSVTSLLPNFMKAKNMIYAVSKMYHEQNDITEHLASIQDDLEHFLKSILDLDISETEKMLYTKITLQLKESIYFYSITGTKGLNIPLKAFGCITKETPEGKSIFEKISGYIGTASDGLAISEVVTKLLS